MSKEAPQPVKADVARVKASTYDPKTHSVEWVLNSGKVDRDGEVLDPKGARLPDSLPLVDSHDLSTFENILGRWTNLRAVDGVGVVGRVSFSQSNPRGKVLEGMVRDGDITQASVGFRPYGWVEADGSGGVREDGDSWPWPNKGRTYTDWAPSEGSVVGVPSDANALVKAAKKYGVDIEKNEAPLTDIDGPMGVTREDFEALQAKVDLVLERLDERHGRTASDVMDLPAEEFFEAEV